MTPEEITNQIMNYQTVLMGIQTLIGLGAVWLALKEINKWRTEEFGKRKIELARELGNSINPIRRSFSAARSPFGSKAPEYKEGSTAAEKDKQDKEYDFQQRVNALQDSLRPLDKFSWEISKLFESDGADELINSLYDKVLEFNIAYRRLELSRSAPTIDQVQYEAYMNIVYRSGNDDKFGKEVLEILTKLEQIADKHYKT